MLTGWIHVCKQSLHTLSITGTLYVCSQELQPLEGSMCSGTKNCDDKLRRVTEDMWQQAQESQVGQLLDSPHYTCPCFHSTLA